MDVTCLRDPAFPTSLVHGKYKRTEFSSNSCSDSYPMIILQVPLLSHLSGVDLVGPAIQKEFAGPPEPYTFSIEGHMICGQSIMFYHTNFKTDCGHLIVY